MKPVTSTSLKAIGILLIVLILINILAQFFFFRIDLTSDKRYTLSSVTRTLVNEVQNPLSIKVYMYGELPADFRRLQQESKQLIEELQAYNDNIVYEFVNPLENPEEGNELVKSLFQKGLTPVNITIDDKGKQSQAMVFPWALATYNDKEVAIPLLKNRMGASTTDKALGSIQNLEYAFTDAINKLTKSKQKKVAVLKGNGELNDNLIGKFLMQIRESYYIAPFTLDSVSSNPQGTLSHLKQYDLAIIAKPTQNFTDEEKQVIDQFIMKGGKTIWLIDQVVAEMDSLYNNSGSTLAFPRDLNLNDMMFKYGIRINPDIVKDEQAAPIKLATGEQGSATQYQNFLWKYAPLSYPINKHPIIKNLGGVKFDFASPIDTLKNNIKKTILLQSSPYSTKVGTPSEISLADVTVKSDFAEFHAKGNYPLAVLLEGSFNSAFQNRVLSFKLNDFQNQSKPTKMIVISDGDLVKNQLDTNGLPVELGYDQRTGNLYDNKDFMINCVNYLLDDNGLINIRSKDFTLPLLDKEKVYEKYNAMQFITIGLPIAILALFGFVFTYLRKRKYSK